MTRTDAPAAPAPSDSAASATAAPAEKAQETDGKEPALVDRAARTPSLTLPEDVEWLVDAEGREYAVLRFSKTNAHRRLPDGRVRLVGGAVLEVVGEDDEAMELKIPRKIERERIDRRPPMGIKPTAAELAAVAATYPAALEAKDQLRFAPIDRGLPRRGHWRNGFAMADMNGDGNLDFVQGPPRKGGDQIRVYLGDGGNTWSAWPTVSPTGLLDYGDVAVADLNRDGHQDVAIAVHLRGVMILLGDGKGGFTPFTDGLDFTVPVIGAAAPTFSSRQLEVSDWNGDGWLDIIALSEGPTSSVGASRSAAADPASPKIVAEYSRRGPRIYLNGKGGRWTAVDPPASAAELFGDDLELGDWNGDGRVDFAASSNLMGRKELIFLASGDSFSGVDLEVRPRAYVKAVAGGDFDGDGRGDLALSYINFELGVTRSGIDLFFNEAGKWKRKALMAKESRSPFEALEAGDINGDGTLDLIGLDRDGGLAAFLGDGKGGFVEESAPEAQRPRGRCRGYGLDLVDLDRDGASEIVATYADEPVALYDPERCTNNGGIMAWKTAPAK